MRIAIIGGGAMGGLWADRLGSTGAEIAIVDVARSVVDALAAEGLTVVTSDVSSQTNPRATSNPSDVGPVDLVYFFTKAHHTRSAAGTAGPLIDGDTTIVSLQNGWGNADTIAEVLGPDRLVFGVTYQSARVDGPGRVACTSEGPTVLGPYADSSDLGRAALVATLQQDAGLPSTATSSVRTEVWKKVVLNTATLPTSALTGLYAGELGQPGAMLDLADAIAEESVRILRAAGYEIDAAERVAFINGLLGRAGNGKASMLQDVEVRRKTEVEVVNGAIVRQAELLGLDAPLNRAMVALIGGLERTWTRT
ncbi:MAG: 2-dehydropantoate 2-reductase [Chloroflexota bacterium]